MTPETLVATLRRLLAENLHGPTSLPRPASGVRHSLMGQADRDSAAFEDQSETDLDAQDPRWVALFEELFVNVPHDDSNDDLLFLVRIDYSFGEQVEQGKPTDPILVKRRVPGAGLPVLEPGIQIDWKQTFFLNLIAQIAANLTVAVCTRQYSVILEEKEEANRNSTDPQNATNGTDRLASTSASTSMPIRNNSLTPSDHSGQAIGMVKKTSRGSLLGTDSLLSQKKTDLPKTLPSSRSLSALSVIASNEGESKAEPIGIGKKASQSYFVCGSAPTGTTTTKGIVKPGASKNPFMDLPPSSSTTSTKESRNPFTAPSSGPVNASPMSSTAQTKTTNPASTPTPAPVPKKSSSRMVARQRIVKKVYSAPYKSRMDVKDAFMNECSYPLVYYTVNDYESSSLHLDVHENEYLCVELSIFLPVCTSPTSRSSPESPDFTSVTTQSTSLSPAPPASHHWSSLDRNTVPFPTPPNTHKIVLFQGAVPYASLQDVFTQKGLQAQNALKLSWSRLNSEAGAGLNGQPLFFGNRYRCGQSLPPNSSSSPSSNSKDRTEFIMMRGPKGKGQCQVAISNLLKSSPVQGDVRSDSSSGDQSAEDRSRGLKSLFGDRFKMMAGAVKSLVGGSSTDGRGLRTDDHGTTDGLMGSITYVNVAWQSIVNDLLDYARKLPPL